MVDVEFKLTDDLKVQLTNDPYCWIITPFVYVEKTKKWKKDTKAISYPGTLEQACKQMLELGITHASTDILTGTDAKKISKLLKTIKDAKTSIMKTVRSKIPKKKAVRPMAAMDLD